MKNSINLTIKKSLKTKRDKHIKLIFVTLIILIQFIISACADSITESTPSVDQNPNSGSIKATFSDIQNKIFNKSCALSGCHVTGVQSPNLSGDAYNTIVNKPSTQGINYIQPGDPAKSYLFMKITGAPGISGVRMPRNASPLPQSSIDSVKAWIERGAIKN